MKDIENNCRTVYQELCNSYRAIDDFRTKLLGFLPLASGTGIFLIISDKLNVDAAELYIAPVGLFGAAITLGLFFFELYGIKKCTCLIRTGIDLEIALGIEDGQFNRRPSGVFGFINEPTASGVIYPAVLAAWVFLAFDYSPCKDFSCYTILDAFQLYALWTFIIGVLFSLYYGRRCSNEVLLDCPKSKSSTSANQKEEQH